ncbi:cation transporter [Maritalea myrionectae]|uniref:cation transporter n=1 Tax=Maritalea myrionectae TaxID=454601 RepID=UPI000427765A|nr:cation transporter [Maritalea myrionectae]
MKKLLILGTGLLVSGVGASFAAEQKVTLSVPGMYCASCPFIVKGAISRLDGIVSVSADADLRQAVVVFEDTATSLDDILLATKNAGYESELLAADEE